MSKTYALTAATLYTGRSILQEHAVVVQDNVIADILPIAQLPAAIKKIEHPNCLIAPGFVDLQLNGCGGVLFNDAITVDTLRTMHHTNLRSGTTCFYPTLITTVDNDMLMAMALIAEMMGVDHSLYGAILGVHLEGPYLNPLRKGIHAEQHIRCLSETISSALLSYQAPCILTLAPECIDNALIMALRSAGICVSVGHSAATYEQMQLAIAAGVSMVTHLFNAMPPLANREPSVIGAAFNSKLYSGIIADGQHVHPSNILLAKEILQEKLFLVTDAVTAAGTNIRKFTFANKSLEVINNAPRAADGTLGGSILTMDQAVRYCVQELKIPLSEALRMASLYPANAVNKADKLGYLAQNYQASMVIMHENDLQVCAVVDRGQCYDWQ